MDAFTPNRQKKGSLRRQGKP